MVTLLDPGIQQGVAHCQHHGADKEADDPHRQQAADNPHQNEDQRQVGAALDQEGTQEVVHGARQQRPDQQEGAPGGVAAPVEVADAGQQHREGANLGDDQQEHHHHQDHGVGDAGNQQTDTGHRGLHQGGHHDPHGHGADRL